MSLIVDINPVPWEILDLVRARILKNRAKKQKRQPGKGKELRRVMQVDNGILAKQRWEEPSFVGGRDRVFAIGFISDALYFPGFFVQIPVSYTVSINGQTLGNVNFPLILNKRQSYFFIWSPDENDKTEILNGLFSPFNLFVDFSDIVTAVVETEQPDPSEPMVIEFSNITGFANPYIANFVLTFWAGFSFDEEFPGARSGGRILSWTENYPDRLTFEINDWK
jgi:hypothetical protein